MNPNKIFFCAILLFMGITVIAAVTFAITSTKTPAEAPAPAEVTVNGSPVQVYTVVDSVTGKTLRYIHSYYHYVILLPDKNK